MPALASARMPSVSRESPSNTSSNCSIGLPGGVTSRWMCAGGPERGYGPGMIVRKAKAPSGRVVNRAFSRGLRLSSFTSPE